MTTNVCVDCKATIFEGLHPAHECRDNLARRLGALEAEVALERKLVQESCRQAELEAERAVALEEQVKALTAERDGLREALVTSSKYHRRAQRLEGIEARMASLRLSHARELGRILHRAYSTEQLWYRRYADVAEQIRQAGIDDRLPGQDNYRTGSVEELLRRTFAEMAKVKAERDDQERQRRENASDLARVCMEIGDVRHRATKAEIKLDEALAVLREVQGWFARTSFSGSEPEFTSRIGAMLGGER